MGRSSKKVYQYDIEGNFLNEYKNSLEASYLISGDDHRRKISICYKQNFFFSSGFIWSSIYYMKIPKNLISEIKKHPNYKFTLYNQKTIYQYDLNGFFTKKYDGLRSITNDINYTTSIIRCLENKLKTSNNYIWKLKYYEKLPENILKNHVSSAYKNVYLYDLKGNFIKQYKSIAELCRNFDDWCPIAARNCINALNTRKYKKHIIRTDYFKKLPKKILEIHLKKTDQSNRKKEVHQFSLDGKFIKSYKSAEEAAQELKTIKKGTIASCCNEYLRSAGGFIWKYKDSV